MVTVEQISSTCRQNTGSINKTTPLNHSSSEAFLSFYFLTDDIFYYLNKRVKDIKVQYFGNDQVIRVNRTPDVTHVFQLAAALGSKDYGLNAFSLSFFHRQDNVLGVA